jgi:excisionase family DNA binding protein
VVSTPMKLITLKEVTTRTGYSRWTIRGWVEGGTFPQPVRVHGHRRLRFVEAEVDRWMTDQVSRRGTESS